MNYYTKSPGALKNRKNGIDSGGEVNVRTVGFVLLCMTFVTVFEHSPSAVNH